MISILVRIFLAIFLTILLNACYAKKSVVVLLPDQDGKTGTIVVHNQGGSQLLDAPNKATAIRSLQTAPESPTAMSADQLHQLFGEVQDAMPSAPAHYTLYFLNDSKEFTAESTHIFNEVINATQKIQPAEISIVGHTDRMGEREQNFRLGLERASQVKRLLMQRGVDAGIVEITSHGEDNPAVKTRDAVAEPRNRRVEIIIR